MKEINIRDIKISATELINDCWGLVTAGNEENFNSMTVSWGALGEIWNMDAAFIFIRHSRYTYEFLENGGLFTLSFYDEKYKGALGRIYGSKSGRDTDKTAESGFTPVFTDGAVTYAEAKYTLVCRVAASQEIEAAGFIDPAIKGMYAGGDMHKMFVGEILKVYENDA